MSCTELGVQRRILLVEDDFIVAGELEYWLREAGFDVVGPAATADDAVRLAVEAKPRLVVMDIRLAGMRDGIDAAIQIYRQVGIRSLFATAHSDPYTLERGKAANPLGWVSKPYSAATLIERIEALFDGHA
ncbi:MAG TPA: response regulator [Pseudolabrys sp.]|jgi:two-component system, response regulator PdtaR